jgi:hypothetical protein
MEAEMVSETLGFYPQLTRLVAREDFVDFVNFLKTACGTYRKLVDDTK